MLKQLSLFCVTAIVVSGCGRDGGTSSDSSGMPNGAALMGLIDRHTLQYLQTDTTISFAPVFSTSVSVEPLVINVARSGDQWIIKAGDTPRVNLRTTSESVIQNGYWQRIDGTDSLFYIAEPPVVMMRSLWRDRTWEGFTPRLAAGQTEVALPFYYFNFGFTFTRTFVDTQPILVPAGSFNTYHFTTELFVNPFDSLPAAHIDEYFAVNVGLIRLNFRGGPLIRTLSLVDYSPERTR